MRDEGLVGSALARPVNLAAYRSPDAAALAASYGVAVAKSLPFVDGNPPAALLCVGACLALHGQRLNVGQTEATLTMRAIADGSLEAAAFAAWIRLHATPRGCGGTATAQTAALACDCANSA
jgi:death on curing protein